MKARPKQGQAGFRKGTKFKTLEKLARKGTTPKSRQATRRRMRSREAPAAPTLADIWPKPEEIDP